MDRITNGDYEQGPIRREESLAGRLEWTRRETNPTPLAMASIDCEKSVKVIGRLGIQAAGGWMHGIVRRVCVGSGQITLHL
jgi:hypothetical protein